MITGTACDSELGYPDDMPALPSRATAVLPTLRSVRRARRSDAAPQPSGEPEHAPFEAFTVMRSAVLCGARLRDVRALQDSIERFGLLSPLVVVRRAGRLVVIDGRKRLAALRRLAFEGRLPRSLVRLPYVLAGDLNAKRCETPSVARNRDLYAAVAKAFRAGGALDPIAARFHISRKCVRDVLALSRLHPAIREAFFDGLIDLKQANAFAAIPDRAVQRRVLQSVGPFASPVTIGEAAQQPRRAMPLNPARDLPAAPNRSDAVAAAA